MLNLDLRSSAAVLFELDNAKTVREKNDILHSFHSVNNSIKNFRAGHNASISIVICGDASQLSEMHVLLTKSNPDFDFETVALFDTGEVKYFENKSLGVRATESDFLLFCDSDCEYEPDYISKMYEALKNNPNSLIHGRTFAKSPNSIFERLSGLSWQFPPEKIGYGDSWPESVWGNSMAMSRETLNQNPFPVLTLNRLSHLDLKLSGHLLRQKLALHGLFAIETEALAYHAQFSSWPKWLGRQFQHGIASATKAENKRPKINSLITNSLANRTRHLRSLEIDGKITAREFRGARRLLRAALLCRIWAFVIVKIFRIRMTIQWPSGKL
jgi:hypothetical protein